MNHDIAGKQLRHAGRVMLDNKFFEFDRERQVLNQYTIALVQNRRAGLGPLCHQYIGTKGGVAGAQSMFWFDIRNQTTTFVG